MSIGVSDEMLALMRADVAELLPDTCVIQFPGTAVDAGGAPLEAYVAVTGGTVGCRLDPLKERSSAVGQEIGRESLAYARQLTCPHDAPLGENARCVIGGRNYEVVALVEDHSWRVSRRAIVKVVE